MFFLREIFGLPPNDSKNNRLNDEQTNFITSDEDNNYKDLRSHWSGNQNTFVFPMFSDLFEMHKHFETLFNEMHDMFPDGPNIPLGDIQEAMFFIFYSEKSDQVEVTKYNCQNTVPPIGEETLELPKSLRDSCLKSPGYIYDNRGVKEDVNLDGKIKIDDVENPLRINFGISEDQSSMAMYSPPKVYSKSVFIKTIRKPDGTVETIKKIQDHTGKEETIVTHTTVADNPSLNNYQLTPNEDPSINNHQLTPNEDIPGFSILKKFFSF